MANEFLMRVKTANKDPRDVFGRLVNKTMQKGEKSMETDTLDEEVYDSESLMGGRIFRGNVYMFTYNAEKPSAYTYGGQTVWYTDTMPIVLVTSETPTTLRGVNLNFCNYALKALVLNLVRELDTGFYDGGGAYRMACAKSLPISKNVYKFFCGDGEAQLARHLSMMFKGVDYGGIIRNYSTDRIRNMRLVEPWQWIDLPFLTYEGSMKKDTIEAIWKISGIDKVRI